MLQVKDLVQARLYPDDEAAIRDAVSALLREKPQMRVEVAIYRYQTGEISLGKAAESASVSFEKMREILVNRGIPLRLGPATVEEMVEEIETLRRHLDATRGE